MVREPGQDAPERAVLEPACPDDRPAVLFTTYAYPPISGPGSIRMAKFAKYLPSCGWRPIVLTVQGGYNPGARLEAPDSDSLVIHRAPEMDPIKILLRARQPATAASKPGRRKSEAFAAAKRVYASIAFPDRDWLWIPGALWAGRKLVGRHSTDLRALFSTSPNITNHLVARHLKRISGLPWIAEFRDFWAFSTVRPPRGSLRSRLEWRLERAICRDADAIVSVSPEYCERFSAEHGVPRSKTAVIYNGYDPADFPRASHSDFQRFSIAHAGSFYGGQRDPTALFQALRSLADDDEIDLGAVQINLYGNYEPAVDRIAEENGLGDVLAWHGYMPYHELVPHLVDSYCLLLLTHQTDMTIPSKVFDYVGCRRPVITLSPQNATLERIVTDTGIGRVIDPSDQAGIARALLEQWTRWRNHDPAWIAADSGGGRVYTRQYQTEQLAKLLDDAVRVAGGGG
jgi:glycosyltransferase involved in cell wall biosynthesis